MTARLLVAFLFLLSNLVLAKTIVVDPAGPFPTLTSALASASSGDTIRVRHGTFREGNISITKKVVILGENYPVFDGEYKYEIFTIDADSVVVSGLALMNTGTASMNDIAAIKVLNSKFVIVRDNRFTDTFFGIHFSNSSESIVDGNRLRASATAEYEIGNGIHMWKCKNMIVRENGISGHRDGIYFEFVTNSTITGNVSENNIRYGLHFMFSHNNEYRENTFTRNGAGVAVMYTTGVKMIENVFDNNWGSASYGLLLKDIRDSFVSGNTFEKNSIGIYMEGSSRIEFKENAFLSNGYAVKLQASCDDNIFNRNNFSANTFDLATNGSLVLNKVDGNYWDRYQGYDLNKDQVGDIPYHPVSMYSMIVEQIPAAVLLWRSFLVLLMDKAEKAIPAITPENLRDHSPAMQPYDFNKRG